MNREAEKSPTYLIDAGDALFNTTYRDARTEERRKNVAQAIIEAYNAMDCKVMNVGVNDLTYGMEFLEEIAAKTTFPLISANTLDKQTGEKLFPASHILKTPDLKIGFVGVTNGDARLEAFQFGDPLTAAQEAVADIRDKVDLVILLANVDDRYETTLAEEVEGVDFLVRSRTARYSRQPLLNGKTVVLRTGNRGKYAGILHVRRPDPVGDFKDLSKQMQRVEFAQRRLDMLAKDVPEGQSLEAYYAKDETRLGLVKNLRAEEQRNRELLETLGNGYFFTVIALDKNIADDPNILPIVEEYITKH